MRRNAARADEYSDEYSDIIERSRPKSLRPAMPKRDRAAQFAPFAALNGYEASIQKAAQAALARVLEAETTHDANSDEP